jgi:hypothetical protein
MNAIRRALDLRAMDPRWFLVSITGALVLMTGAMYWSRSSLERIPSLADQQRALRVQEKMRTLLPADFGRGAAELLAICDEQRVTYAELLTTTRRCLGVLSGLGIVGCVLNGWPRVRRRVLGDAN